jgi:hypothetical protein
VLFDMSSYRDSRGRQNSLHISRDNLGHFFSSDLPAIIGFHRLRFEPHAATPHQPSTPFHTFGLRTTTSDLPKIASAGPQVQQAATTTEEPQIVGTKQKLETVMGWRLGFAGNTGVWELRVGEFQDSNFAVSC